MFAVVLAIFAIKAFGKQCQEVRDILVIRICGG